MRNAPALGIDADHGQLAARDLNDLVRLEAVGLDSHPDFNRTSTGTYGPGIEADPVPDVDRFLEFDTSEGDSHPAMASMFSRLVESSLVDQREDHPSEDRSQWVRVARHHLYP